MRSNFGVIFSYILEKFVKVISFESLFKILRQTRPFEFLAMLVDPLVSDPFTSNQNRAGGMSREVVALSRVS